MTFRLQDGFTLQEAMDILTGENDEDFNIDTIYITPPEPSVLTDEDSGDEDEGGLVDNLSGRQLLAQAEIKLSDNRVVTQVNELYDIIDNQSVKPPATATPLENEENISQTDNNGVSFSSEDNTNNELLEPTDHETLVRNLKRKKEIMIEKRNRS